MILRPFRKFCDINSTKKIDIISALVTNVSNHSLLDSLYIYKHNNLHYGYILQDKKTQKILAIDCGDYKTQRFNIEHLMKETGGAFDSIFFTNDLVHRTEGVFDWKRVHPDLKVFKAGSKDDGHIEFIGELCIYFLHNPGLTENNTSYVITEVSESSTKTPVVFTGDFLTTGGCGKAKDFKSFYNSLNKIKSLPNETLIFPGSEFAAENLIFAKIIDTNNEFVKNKLDEVKNKDRNFGQVLGQERLYNPFFRCDQKYFLNLFEAEDPFSCFVKMKKMMEKIIKNQAD